MPTLNITVDEYWGENTANGFSGSSEPLLWLGNLLSKSYGAADWIGKNLSAESRRQGGKSNCKVVVSNSRFIHRYLKTVSLSDEVRVLDNRDDNFKAFFDFEVIGEEPEMDQSFEPRLKELSGLFHKAQLDVEPQDIYIYRENGKEWAHKFAETMREKYSLLCSMGLEFIVLDDDGFRNLQGMPGKRERILAVMSIDSASEKDMSKDVLPRIVFGVQQHDNNCIYMFGDERYVDFWNVNNDAELEDTLALYADYYMLKPMFMYYRMELLKKPWNFMDTKLLLEIGLKKKSNLLDGRQGRTVVLGTSIEYPYVCCFPFGDDKAEKNNVEVSSSKNLKVWSEDHTVVVKALGDMAPADGSIEFSSKMPLFVWRGGSVLEECRIDSASQLYSSKITLFVEGNGLCHSFNLTGSTNRCAVGDELTFKVDAQYWLGRDRKINEELVWLCKGKPIDESSLSNNRTVLKMIASEPGDLEISARTSLSFYESKCHVKVFAHANRIKINLNRLSGKESDFCIVDSTEKDDVIKVRCEGNAVFSLVATAVNDEHQDVWNSSCDIDGMGNGVLVRAGDSGSHTLTIKALDPDVKLERKLEIKAVFDPGTIWSIVLLATMLVGLFTHLAWFGLNPVLLAIYALTPIVMIKQIGQSRELLRTEVQRFVFVLGLLFWIGIIAMSFFEEIL
ncbi:MAG: hypothetical protein J6X55_13420 [Victivallales bacterium]|nr:hypothetical protein [Victivallales bacterium]